MRARPSARSAGFVMVANSTERMLSAFAAPSRLSIVAVSSVVNGRLLVMMASALISVRASPAKVLRTLWTTDRSATMAPTPTAMQIKKNSRRCQEARISRTAMNSTNLTVLLRESWFPVQSSLRRPGARRVTRAAHPRLRPRIDRASP